ncbi:thioesterase [Cupriavidus sp. UYMMa02A]|nr:thioesterase [Cupriavidus sp. UYMMa02A]
MNMTEMQAIVDRSPLNRWLGMTVQAVGDDSVSLTVKWREELVSSPERRSTHGGILATLIDGAGDYAVAASLGRAVPTLDLHVDYHRVAAPGDLRVDAGIVHIGGTVATAAARVYDMSGRMVASGRGLYFVGAKPAN